MRLKFGIERVKVHLRWNVTSNLFRVFYSRVRLCTRPARERVRACLFIVFECLTIYEEEYQL